MAHRNGRHARSNPEHDEADMPPTDHSRPPASNHESFVVRLERATGFVLGLVILAVGWILAASAAPELATLGNQKIEVAVVLALLTLALALVAVVALLHTRGKQ